jgi:acyl dehydratase
MHGAMSDSVSAADPVQVGGPYFEDFEVGQLLDDAPSLTLTSGHAAMHQALVGDRLRLCLDATLCAAVTGRAELLVHPNLICDVAIGQSTGVTQRVRGNLFYRGLVLRRPMFVGDTMRTRTEVVGLRQNRRRGDGPATGLVALRIQTENQDGDCVLDFWRCPMIPLRDAEAETGHADAFDDIPQELDLGLVADAIPKHWSFDAAREQAGGAHFADIAAGSVYEVEGRDTVTAPTELVRLTLNIAQTHSDAGASAHGHRLVYGGHTISVAAAHVTRALPNLMTILAWRECNHTGPVYEGDILSTLVTVEDTHELDDVDAGIVEVRAVMHAEREGADEPQPVLDWRLAGAMA